MVKLGLEWQMTPTRSEIDTLTHWLGFFFVAWLGDYFLPLQWAVVIAITASIGLELVQKYAPSVLAVGEKGSKPAPQVRDLISDGLGIGLYASMVTAGFQGTWDWVFTAASGAWLIWQFIRATPRKHKI
jgi:hypothetical protein